MIIRLVSISIFFLLDQAAVSRQDKNQTSVTIPLELVKPSAKGSPCSFV